MKILILLLLLEITSFSQKAFSQENNFEVLSDGIKITPKERQENMQFGWSVDVEKNYVFVGSPFYSSNNKYKDLGIVHIFKKDKNNFHTIYNMPPHYLQEGLQYGKCVKYSYENELTLISSSKNSYCSNVKKDVNGMVSLYSHFTSYKKIQKVLMLKKNVDNVHYADQIDISEKYIISNAPFYKNKNGSTGLVSVYKIEEDSIILFKELAPPSGIELFGQELAISDNNQIIITANNKAFIYVIRDGEIVEEAFLEQDNTENFGNAVAIRNDYAFIACSSRIPSYFGREFPPSDSIITILERDENGIMKTIIEPYTSNFNYEEKTVIGYPIPVLDSIGIYKEMENINAEKIFVYKRSKGKWELHQKLTSNKRIPFEFFGNSIDVKDSLCVVGAFSSPITYEFNNMNAYAGAAYVFELAEDGYWSLIKKIVPEKREYWTKFGFSVATDGKSVVVGSRFDKTNNKGEDRIENAGAVYFFSIKKE